MKKALRFGIHACVILVAVVVFYQIYSDYLEERINTLYAQHAVTVNHAMGVPSKDKGNILAAKSLENHNMVVLGSSELGSPVPENIRKLFPNNLYPSDITCFGHAYVQNFEHAMNLAANYTALKDNGITIIESLQWFSGNDIDIKGFLSNFSELQFYEFLQNDCISEKNKLHLCRRYMQLENSSGKKLQTLINKYYKPGVSGNLFSAVIEGEIAFPSTYLYANLYSSPNSIYRICYQLLRPYYWARYKFLQLKDKHDAYIWLKNLKNEEPPKQVELDWKQIYQTAEKHGKEACTNNDIYVYDAYYTKYLQKTYAELKGRSSKEKLLVSKEWEDYVFFLDVCKELGLSPYIVSMSTNGWYYDYLGIDKNKRDLLYDKLETGAKEYGMGFLSCRDHEYEPYFYCDVMHLGWKGWPYVTQNIIAHFSK